MKKQSNKRHNQVSFKPYNQDQAWLLPPTLGELIPENHIARLVNTAIDGMDLTEILNAYEGGGASTYHPKMLLKALIYGYIEKTYSSRKIEKALKENICFMWLCGMQQPDHNTINRFRKGKLKDTVKDVFAKVLLLLIEQGFVKLEDYYVDGTKIESVAGRYTFVWAKNVERYKKGLLEKIAKLLDQIEASNEAEEQSLEVEHRDEQGNMAVMDSVALKQTIDSINEQLGKQMQKNKRLQKKMDKLEQDHLNKLREYEEQQKLLNDRNSYSKTDPDATFMRMKDDHMKNGQLKPGYNIQIGSSEQFIINYSIHQNSTDYPVFTTHFDDTIDLLEGIGQNLPQRIIGDAGYGSEQNYQYLEDKQIEAYLKYPGYYQESKSSFSKKLFHKKNLYYNEEQDYFVCPMGQHLTYSHTKEVENKQGFKSTVSIYQAQRCEGCPLRSGCHKAKENRSIQVNHNLERHRKCAKEKLNSELGIELKKQRNYDVEPVFGHIKSNRGFKRFMLRSLPKVNIEFGLLAIAHNLKKWWAKTENQKSQGSSPSNPKPNAVNKGERDPKTAFLLLKSLFGTSLLHRLYQCKI